MYRGKREGWILVKLTFYVKLYPCLKYCRCSQNVIFSYLKYDKLNENVANMNHLQKKHCTCNSQNIILEEKCDERKMWGFVLAVLSVQQIELYSQEQL